MLHLKRCSMTHLKVSAARTDKRFSFAQLGTIGSMADTPAQIVLRDSERATVLLHYFRGFDPGTTYRSLWPSRSAPFGYQEFIRLYVEEVIAYHAPAGAERRSALDEDGKTAIEQLRKVRDLCLKAIEQCCNEPLEEIAEGKYIDRMPSVAPLIKAHSATIAQIAKLRRGQLEEAAALHSLMTSNADRDGSALDE